MTASAVHAEGLGKDYRIGVAKQRSVTLSETLQSSLRRPASALRRRARHESVTVLDDISFDIRTGEAVGFIGHNGAGKSTLLTVLSRITSPTRGRAVVRGRMGALLEVATGFHPELTGRENVFLNGAVLGMSRLDTARRFDEIVAFADVDKFLDTPVKRFSSGMVLRLAFSVAAHLEPDILVIDEVLAVGDAGFQQRCLRRMAEVAEDGRTVLFVSHNMSVLQSLCRRGIVLQHGRVLTDGPVEQAISAYLSSLEDLQRVDLRARTDRSGAGEIRLVDLTIATGSAATGEPLTLSLRLDQGLVSATCEVRLVNEMGVVVTTFSSAFLAPHDVADQAPGCFTCHVDELLLAAGRYRLDVVVRTGPTVQDDIQAAALLDVAPAALHGRAVSLKRSGSVVMPHVWHVPA
jgi:lipopolysaccharide transport system ATP-binding protein